MRPRGEDAGSTHVLEAVLIASIMVSAVAFVVTFETPPSGSNAARQGLEQVASDALAIMHDTPVTSKFGKDALSAYIAECLNNQCTNLTTKLSSLVPPGASYALYVSNGYDTYPVYIMGQPKGEAVSSTETFEPGWSSTFLATATDSVGVGNPLLTYGLPIFNSIPVTPGGSQLLLRVSGTRSDGSDYVLIASAATLARADTEPDAVGASLNFVDASGNAMGHVNVTDAFETPQPYTLRLRETQGGEIPVGTEITVEMPRGWSATATSNANWEILSQATDRNGSYVGSAIRAKLLTPLSEDTTPYADLVFQATYWRDVLDVYTFHAHATKGAHAQAALLVRSEVFDSDPVLATPLLTYSVPSPMGSGVGGKSTTWTLSAYIPVNATSANATNGFEGGVRVHTVEILEKEGTGIFGGVTASPTEAMGGTWTNGIDSLVWRGEAILHYENFLNLTFHVTASGTAGPSEARSAFTAPVTFDTWTGKLTSRTGWGFQREAILPATQDYQGYDPDTGLLFQAHPLTTSGVYRSTPLPGAMVYNASQLGAVRDSLYGSYVSAANRTVPLGGKVIIDANVQSVLYALQEAGQPAGVTMRFYPPWSGDERVPIFEQQNLDQDILSGETTQIVLVDVNGDGYPDPVIGTTNGRVVAYHGLTGVRLQGNSFTAPANTFDANGKEIPASISAMETIVLDGDTYIVVGTNEFSDGIFVLDQQLRQVWSYSTQRGTVTALDTKTDFTTDGRSEIAAAVTLAAQVTPSAITYLFEAIEGQQYLTPITGNTLIEGSEGGLFASPGHPTSIVSFSNAGPFGSGSGLAVPIQTTLDAGLNLAPNMIPPIYERGTPSTPRAGLQAINAQGEPTSTLFGAPASVARAYDYGGDTIDDLVFGGSSGYVIMANGEVLTQPLYSYLLVGSDPIISADTPRHSSESYVLFEGGAVIMTDDAWITNWGPETQAPGGLAISSNRFNSFWVAGVNNQIWKSILSPEPPTPGSEHMPPYLQIQPVTTHITGNPTYFTGRVHEFRDVWFRGTEGWIVTDKCPMTCPMGPAILRTTDEGATWSVENPPGITKDLNRIKFLPAPHDVGFILGDDGTLLRRLNGGSWTDLSVSAPSTTHDFKDIACDPVDHNTCFIVGTGGAAYILNDARGQNPVLVNATLAGRFGLPADRDLFSVGWPAADRMFIGSKNMVLMKVGAANWTTMPMNYVEADGLVINALPDGTGYVYGAGVGTGRIWFLHDYFVESQAQTIALTDEFPDTQTKISKVKLIESDVSLGLMTVSIDAATNGPASWKSLGSITVSGAPGDDFRDNREEKTVVPLPPALPYVQELMFAEWAVPDSGRDLTFRITLKTDGDKTLISPHVRLLKFRVHYNDTEGPKFKDITLDFDTVALKDAAQTTAIWDLAIGALRQPLVQEYWVRNVSGEVLDLRTGFDVVDATGGSVQDGKHEIWVSTGDVLAENSPDHIIYAGTDRDKIINPDNRVYLLNGLNGHTQAISKQLYGQVRQIRLADVNNDLEPEMLYAVTWHEPEAGAPKGEGRLYALNPVTLLEAWNVTFGVDVVNDLELGKFVGDHTSAFIGTQRSPTSGGATGYLRAMNTTSQKNEWRVIPDDLGKYNIEAKVQENWLYGPYVVEVEVEWEETVTHQQIAEEVVRSARFYDHFMVTPPDLLSPPTPLYTARLLVWMEDWG